MLQWGGLLSGFPGGAIIETSLKLDKNAAIDPARYDFLFRAGIRESDMSYLGTQ